MNAYLWLDLETTGPRHDRDVVLEVGCVLTTPDLRRIGEWYAAVDPEDQHPGWRDALLDDWARDQHGRSGLLDEIDELGVPTGQAERELLGWVRRMVPEIRPRDVRLCGSGVGHFDQPILRRCMPDLVDFVHYAPLDVGSVRRFLAEVCGIDVEALLRAHEVENEQPHRALSDVRHALGQARAYRAAVTE